MADIQNQNQAKPVQREALTKREQFAMTFGASLLSQRPNATPGALAKLVVTFTDAFLEALAAQVN